MTCLTCPNCGYDLERIGRLTIGDLEVNGDGGEIRWKGELVALTPSESLIVAAMGRCAGAPIRRSALAAAAGYEGDRPRSIVNIYISRIRKAFRALDPTFDALETSYRAGGTLAGYARWQVVS